MTFVHPVRRSTYRMLANRGSAIRAAKPALVRSNRASGRDEYYPTRRQHVRSQRGHRRPGDPIYQS